MKKNIYFFILLIILLITIFISCINMGFPGSDDDDDNNTVLSSSQATSSVTLSSLSNNSSLQSSSISSSSLSSLPTSSSLSFSSSSSISTSYQVSRLFWTSYGSSVGAIKSLDIDNTPDVTVIRNDINYQLKDIRVDSINSKLYWLDTNLDTLYWSNMDGSGDAPLMTGLTYICCIALDPPGNAIYYIDDTTINKADLDGTNGVTLIDRGGTTYPGRIVLDMIDQNIYWSENQTSVWRSNLDGSVISTIKSVFDVQLDIGLDIINERIYIAPNLGSNSINSMNYDGTDDTFIATTAYVELLAVDFINEKIYYIMNNRRIFRINLDGSNNEVVYTEANGTTITGLSFLYE